MHTLLHTELGDKHIERSFQNVDDLGLANNRAVALRQVRNEDAQEQMRGLLLRKVGRIPLDVALLRNLGDSVAIHGELGVH